MHNAAKNWKRTAMQIRITGLKMVQNAHSGHIGGAFSLSEIMSVLYFDKMNIRPEEPDWEDRDRFALFQRTRDGGALPHFGVAGLL